MRARLGLRRAEKVLAAAVDGTGRWWVATRAGLLLAPAEGSVRRLPWEQIEHAEWDRDSSTFTLVESGPSQPGLPATTAVFERADHLLEVVRDLVSSTVVLVRQMPLPSVGGDALVTVRRRIADGELLLHVSYGAGLDPNDPAVQAAGSAAAALIGDEVGL